MSKDFVFDMKWVKLFYIFHQLGLPWVAWDDSNEVLKREF